MSWTMLPLMHLRRRVHDSCYSSRGQMRSWRIRPDIVFRDIFCQRLMTSYRCLLQRYNGIRDFRYICCALDACTVDASPRMCPQAKFLGILEADNIQHQPSMFRVQSFEYISQCSNRNFLMLCFSLPTMCKGESCLCNSASFIVLVASIQLTSSRDHTCRNG